MASMPFDVASASLAGTRDWTQLNLKFVATRARDQIEIRGAHGGALEGRFWVEGLEDIEGLWPGDERAADPSGGPCHGVSGRARPGIVAAQNRFWDLIDQDDREMYRRKRALG